MCGIAGRVNLFSRAPVEPAVVAGMCEALAHRGPDGAGLLVDGFAGFGHRRLAIIDLSPAGRQPMTRAAGRYWITFNGEIYNYRELRQRLEAEGAAFSTATDTEVLLAAWERYGPSCLELLRGMFAFAIWDARDRRLFMARDRVGKKPCYYRIDRDGIAFASETKAFLAEPAFTPEANPAAVSAYLALQYVPSPWSAFEGVRSLPPAHYLLATADGVAVQRYWRLRYEPKSTASEAELEEQLRSHLRDAVSLRLISDVPLGAFLSGGLDSSVVVAFMTELGGHQGTVRTFSIGFGEPDYNELPYARLVADHFHTDHHEFVVTPDITDVLPRLVEVFSEPFADSSALPTYYLSELTRRHVSVALNGDGGDENFAGYDRYAIRTRNAAYARLPSAVREPVAAVANWLPESDDRFTRLRRWTRFHALPEAERAVLGRMLLDPDAKARLCTRDFLDRAGADAAVEHLRQAALAAAASDGLDRQLSLDVDTYLPGALLPKVDITTMAFGLEGRSPLLDHVLMEFCARLPVNLKRRGGTGKILFRRLASRMLPASLLDRPKRGFSVPLAAWFRRELSGFVKAVLLDDRCRTRGILNPVSVERLLREHDSGKFDWHEQIWILLMLELWCVTYLDRRPCALAAGPVAGGRA